MAGSDAGFGYAQHEVSHRERKLNPLAGVLLPQDAQPHFHRVGVSICKFRPVVGHVARFCYRAQWKSCCQRIARTIEVVPKVTFLPANQTFEFDSDKLPYKGHGKPLSLLDVAMNFGFHLEHACGGSCACTTCHVVVKEGRQHLSEMDDDEMDRVEQAADYQLNSRLGCQAVIHGGKDAAVTVSIPEWNRNYVSEGH